MDLIRLTVDFATQRVMVNDKTHRAHGRSAYLCRVKACVNQALKGTRLKFALNGESRERSANKALNQVAP